MLENHTKARLQNGEVVVGAFFKYAEATLAEFVAMQGWDFMIFDGEHGTIQPADVENLCRATELRGVTPIVRATTNQPHVILRFMDAGPHGVHVPWVNTVEGVQNAVKAVKYWPEGERGLAGSRASEWGMNEPIAAYTARANRETMVVIHIETIQAVELVEQYVGVDGVDVLFIGPTDLSHSMGHPGEIDHPDVVAAMERVAETVAPSTKALGIYAGTSRFARDWIDRGARYIATGADGFLKKGMKEYLEEVRS